MARNAPPDQDQVLQLTGMVQLPKGWISVGAIPWVDAGGRPKGWKFREHLALEGAFNPLRFSLKDTSSLHRCLGQKTSSACLCSTGTSEF